MLDTAGGQTKGRISVRDSVLRPIFFQQSDIKIDEPCTPKDIFDDPRFMELLSPGYEFAHPLFERVLDIDQSLSKDEIQTAGRAFRTALSRWHKKIAWLERVIPYEEGTGNEQPLSAQDLANAITAAAETFFKCLLELGYRVDDNAEIDSDVKENIAEKIRTIRDRITSVVLYEDAPVTVAAEQKGSILASLANLRTVGTMNKPNIEAPIYFGGSKRSDVACATNGEKLLANLQKLRLDPREFEIVTLRLSGNSVIMVVPRGAQGIIGLKDLFAEVGVLITQEEAGENPDVFYLGLPDEVFNDVEGIVQGDNGGITRVDSGYKRFHHTMEDGSVVYIVGCGKDSNGRDIDYFGPYKKGPFQVLATRQLRKATQLLAGTGRPVCQPLVKTTGFSYNTCPREISDAEASRQMVAPFHGTFLCWSNADLTLAQITQALQKNRTDNHTIFEGQSGMGKSEMEQFLRVVLRNLRHLYRMMCDSNDPRMQELASGLAPLDDAQLYSAGDDMGQLEVNERGELKCRTHERSRFTRLDNIPTIQGLVARATNPLGEDGNVTTTSNTRVLQRDMELEALHQIPASARIFVLASNLPLKVEGLNPDMPVQEVDFEQYMQAYARYVNQPNGTKNTTNPVKSPAAMHEFLGQFSIAGGAGCENAVAVRRFMLEREIERRGKTKARPMRFYVINTGVKPDWMSSEEFTALDDAGRQKVCFANSARHWTDVPGLMPERVRQALKHAEENLGLNLGRLAYHSESWTVAKLEKKLTEEVKI